MLFQEFGLADSILRAVQGEGYTEPTPIQAQAIPHILAGRDVMGCAQTGTGKTAAFALPTLHRLTTARQNAAAAAEHGSAGRRGPRRRIRCLIMVPTRELAAQVCLNFQTYGRQTGLQLAVIYGGVSQVPQVRSLQSGTDIVVATPGRLLDLIEQGYVDLRHVEMLILDEADQMLDMGFLPDLRQIVASVPPQRQTLMFSATMSDEIRQVAKQWLRDPVQVQVAPVATPAAQVEQALYRVDGGQKPKLLVHFLRQFSGQRTLVFSRTKHGADKIVKNLQKSGINAAAMHGNKSQAVRQRVLQQFKSQRPIVLVATDVAARGLDVDAISYVVNYDLPDVPEVYVHRIGRTGRAGASGRAISFCGADEQAKLRRIENLMRKRVPLEPTPVCENVPTADTKHNGRPDDASAHDTWDVEGDLNDSGSEQESGQRQSGQRSSGQRRDGQRRDGQRSEGRSRGSRSGSFGSSSGERRRAFADGPGAGARRPKKKRRRPTEGVAVAEGYGSETRAARPRAQQHATEDGARSTGHAHRARPTGPPKRRKRRAVSRS